MIGHLSLAKADSIQIIDFAQNFPIRALFG